MSLKVVDVVVIVGGTQCHSRMSKDGSNVCLRVCVCGGGSGFQCQHLLCNEATKAFSGLCCISLDPVMLYYYIYQCEAQKKKNQSATVSLLIRHEWCIVVDWGSQQIIKPLFEQVPCYPQAVTMYTVARALIGNAKKKKNPRTRGLRLMYFLVSRRF